MNARVAQRLLLENRLRKAVAQRQLVLHYQTKVDLANRQVRGLEALIRWDDPDHGLVSPMEFVPVLEECGLIVEVGRWVLEQAVTDMESWRSLGLAVPRIAVNVSEVQLRQPNFVATVLEAIGYATGQDRGDRPGNHRNHARAKYLEQRAEAAAAARNGRPGVHG